MINRIKLVADTVNIRSTVHSELFELKKTYLEKFLFLIEPCDMDTVVTLAAEPLDNQLQFVISVDCIDDAFKQILEEDIKKNTLSFRALSFPQVN